MKHHKAQRKLGRVRKVRTALLRSLVQSLVKHGRIETTLAKAKELRPNVERLITIAKKNSLASRRLLIARLGNDMQTAKKLQEEIAPKYKDRPGGYTRISKLGVTKESSTDKAIIELI
ncbi:MAG: 50S ribosomal protein L17 [bacterium]|nr:50S ribosomal protein L17 [bacterium]